MSEGKTIWYSMDRKHSVEARGALMLFDFGAHIYGDEEYYAGRQHYIADDFFAWELPEMNYLCVKHKTTEDHFRLRSHDREMLKDFHDKIIEAQNVALMYLYRMGRGR